MLTSLVIPTFNGLHRLKTTLPSWLLESWILDEIVIVIDGSTDGTEEWLRHLELPQNVSIYYQNNKGRAAARNFGALNSTGDLLIFIDDDIRISVGFAERHINLHKMYPGSICSGPAFQDLDTDTNYDFCKFRRQREDLWLKEMPSDGVQEIFCFTTQNLSIEKSVFEQLNGFDERLTDSEDFILGIIARRFNIPIYYDPALAVQHCDYTSLLGFSKRNVEYLLSKQVISRLYPEVSREYSYVLATPSGGFVKSVLRRVFEFSAVWDAIVESQLFMLLPMRIRYIVYDLIISSTVYFGLEAARQS